MLVIDGSYGEGGGQILRTSLALSAITGQPVRIEGIRAGRRKPGLMPQHLTAVQAAKRICNAGVEGAKRNSQTLEFHPGSAPQAGTYTFDVAQAAKGGSAGSVSLILQTVLVPLALAEGTSQVTLVGGTHVAWSPPYDYLKRVYLPALARMGITAKMTIKNWGWYPIGGGRIQATIQGRGSGTPIQIPDAAIANQVLRERGALLRVRGLSASSNLPKHIRNRQERAALQALRSNGVNVRVDVVDAPSKGQGTIVFLWAEFENTAAGFKALGELGKPAERVAEEAAEQLLKYLRGDAALDRYLADQLVLPLTLAAGPSEFTTEAVTAHLLTNAWAVNQFFPGRVHVTGREGEPGSCSIGHAEKGPGL
ncbi:MAG: RNA 3'-terminal phosphate cyclase [Anaerolineae bacterium]|jgi:RNA 3'-terminal phosphate cyclase (ATP)